MDKYSINHIPKSPILCQEENAPFKWDIPITLSRKSGYLAIVGIEDFRLKESDD